MSALKETVRRTPDVEAPQAEPGAGRRRAERALRPPRTALGAMVAVGLTCAGGLAAADAARVLLLGAAPRVLPLPDLRTVTWADASMLVVAAILIVAGGLLLAAGLLPGRVRLVPLESADPVLVIGVTYRGLCRSLVATCGSVPGVDRAQVRLRRDFIEVTVTSSSPWTGGIVPAVRTAVDDRLCAMGVLRDRYVAVRLMRAQV